MKEKSISVELGLGRLRAHQNIPFIKVPYFIGHRNMQKKDCTVAWVTFSLLCLLHKYSAHLNFSTFCSFPTCK